MSNTESFLEEVAEEVRKDQMYGYLRKYGWIIGVLVAAIILGVAYSEWAKARNDAQTQARGDALIAALAPEDSASQLSALAELNENEQTASLLSRFQEANILYADDQKEAAIAKLDALANDADIAQIYRELAALRSVSLQGTDLEPAARRAILEPLSAPGAAFRPLALEQLAMVALAEGDQNAAITQFSDLLQEPQISANLQQRAVQMIVALGGEVPETLGAN